MTCPLCTLEKRTKWLYEDDTVVVLICETCGVPMMVWREHGSVWTYAGIYMEEIREKYFSEYVWRKQGPRKIKNHYHWHLVSK